MYKKTVHVNVTLSTFVEKEDRKSNPIPHPARGLRSYCRSCRLSPLSTALSTSIRSHFFRNDSDAPIHFLLCLSSIHRASVLHHVNLIQVLIQSTISTSYCHDIICFFPSTLGIEVWKTGIHGWYAVVHADAPHIYRRSDSDTWQKLRQGLAIGGKNLS